MLVAACATPEPAETIPDRGFAEPAAAEVIAVGLGNISDKYIEPVDLTRIGVEGLRGLGAIDAGLTLRRGDGQIALFENGFEIARMGMPEDDDAHAWAAAIVALTEKARRHSPDIQQASYEKILEAIFDGALSDLDIFSRYAGTVQATRNRAKREGFGGIGVRFRSEQDAIVVTQVLDGTPAASGGILVGDRITHIQGTSIQGLSGREITRLIRGPVHTHVQLTVQRNGHNTPIRADISRAHIVPETVFVKKENGIAIVRIKSFNQDTSTALEKTLLKLNGENDDLAGVILDLRGNPGGLLRQSIKVADLLLTQGDILRTIGRHPDSLHHYEASGEDLAAGLPMVVLIDGKSASAAEIVAAALQDRDRAVVIGTSSYGKGSVQTVIRLPNDGEITLTWSKFVAPSGYYLHGYGVVPTICTSGKLKLDDASLIISEALEKSASEKLESWQRRAFLSVSDRQQLRNGCPAETRNGPLDVEIAKRLILNDRLHSRALRMTTVTAQARH